jgi:hypothetical protein
MAVEEDSKKGLGCEKKTLYVLQLQWDSYKSIARIRLLRTENPSTCVTVNNKVCNPAWRRVRIPPHGPASHRRRRNGKTAPGVITVPPCSWRI